ncbi:MAG TPA: hypothetical protein PKD45_07075 [Flavobacteriales bacterium]|nr:hypothetical protein [Flavobacteriales bacterium]
MRTWWALLFTLLTMAGAAQDSVRYNAGYAFHDGIYFNFQAFRGNTPSVPLSELTTSQGQRVTSLRTAGDRLFRPDSTSQRVRLDLDRVWGFCEGGIVYVRAGNGFSRIGLMGSLAHLTYDATYRNIDPYMMYGGTTYTVEEQRFLDMATGAFLPVSAAGIRQALQRDAILLEEFDTLPKKQRKRTETIFLFMRRYNDRHPLYFPAG